MYIIGRSSFWSWFDVINRSTFDEDMREERFYIFVPSDLDLWPLDLEFANWRHGTDGQKDGVQHLMLLHREGEVAELHFDSWRLTSKHLILCSCRHNQTNDHHDTWRNTSQLIGCRWWQRCRDVAIQMRHLAAWSPNNRSLHKAAWQS